MSDKPDMPEKDPNEQGASVMDPQDQNDNVNHESDADATTQGESPAEPVSVPVPPPAAPAKPEAPAASSGDADDEDEILVMPGMNWFVLRVASNKEDYVRETLLRKIKIEGLTHLVNRILVPTEKEKTIKGGKQKILLKKLYPGYVFVEMKLEPDGRIPQDVFFLIKETTGVGDFIGTAGRPSPMTTPEIEKMQAASKPAEEAPTVKMEFRPGDMIRITEGPFENMEGTVDEVLPTQGKVRVIVQVFGRATPVEMEYWLIERLED